MGYCVIQKGIIMRFAVFVLVLVPSLALTGSLSPSRAGAACVPGGMQRSELLALRAAKWQVPDDARRHAAQALARLARIGRATAT